METIFLQAGGENLFSEPIGLLIFGAALIVIPIILRRVFEQAVDKEIVSRNS